MATANRVPLLRSKVKVRSSLKATPTEGWLQALAPRQLRLFRLVPNPRFKDSRVVRAFSELPAVNKLATHR